MKRIDVGDTSLALHASGDPTLPPLLLLHGFPLDHSMWAGQEPLSSAARLLVPDLRGFGGSGLGAGIGSVARLADDMARLVEAEAPGERVVVGGLSMGGYVAQSLAASHPGIVRGLILVDTRLEADTPEARANRASLSEGVGRHGPRIAAEAMVPKLLAASSAGTPRRRELESLLRQTILSTGADTIRSALSALGARPDMTEAMRRVEVPTLAVVGEEDSITPPSAMERIVEVMPRAELVVIPGCGHMTPMEDPAAFNRAVLAFLAAGGG